MDANDPRAADGWGPFRASDKGGYRGRFKEMLTAKAAAAGDPEANAIVSAMGLGNDWRQVY